jgi:hypothetical protein
MAIKISCINKDDRINPYERITHIGGKNNDGGRWKMTQQQAISDIKSGKYNFYVEIRGDRADVIVAKSRFGNDYIKTVADGDEPNNLLSLPECP